MSGERDIKELFLSAVKSGDADDLNPRDYTEKLLSEAAEGKETRSNAREHIEKFINGITGGDPGPSVTVERLTATENKTYTAPEGVAYNPVIVNVPSAQDYVEEAAISGLGTTEVIISVTVANRLLSCGANVSDYTSEFAYLEVFIDGIEPINILKPLTLDYLVVAQASARYYLKMRDTNGNIWIVYVNCEISGSDRVVYLSATLNGNDCSKDINEWRLGIIRGPFHI